MNFYPSASSELKTEAFELQVARNLVAGHRIEHIFGYNPDIDSGTEETIWTYGGLYSHLAEPTILKISSGSTNDTAAGTGARTVYILGINGDGSEVAETVTLNGQTAVNTTYTYTEIQRMVVMTVGSGGVNAGQIYAGTGTVTTGVPANVYGHIAVGENQSLMGHFTVPAGYTGYMMRGKISSGTPTNGYVVGRLKIRDASGVSRTGAIVTFYAGAVIYDFDYPIAIPAGSCISATAVTTKNDELISCYFQLLLVKGSDNPGYNIPRN
jgi:hypothetical protein